MTALLSVCGLTKEFAVREGWRTRQVRALSDVSFDVDRGEAVALVGESGSGKSTAARLVARLLPPTRGEIRVAGRDALAGRRPPRWFRSQVQMIFQDPFGSLNPVHTVGYHLARPLALHRRGQSADERAALVHRLLETVGLLPPDELARKHVHELSGGQRQRVAIARALAVEPQLILADEPTSMLDASIRMGLLNLLAELKRERGIALVFITHDLASARYLAERTVVLFAGHVVESGPSADVMNEPAHPYTRLLVSSVPDPRGCAGLRPPARARAGAPAVSGAGCPFAERCPDVMDRCRSELPSLEPISPGRLVRCHLYLQRVMTPVGGG